MCSKSPCDLHASAKLTAGLSRCPRPSLPGGLPDQSALLEELPAEIQGDILTVYHTLVRHRPSGPRRALCFPPGFHSPSQPT